MMDALLASGMVPDALIRFRIRQLLALRLRDERAGGLEAVHNRFRERLSAWSQGPVAVNTAEANEQHYEVPPRFFEYALGPRLKYSSAYFDDATAGLGGAEERMLEMTCQRAELKDGQTILELGCGWGSLTLWMAERYPKAKILGVSNSRDQREHILAQAQARGLRNVEIQTADMNTFQPNGTFDRVVSVEMFEHMRNHRELLRRIASWLQDGGKLFVHIFTHVDLTYPFEVRDESDWMAKYFFTGGMMPSDAYLMRFQEHLALEEHWRVSGTHYQRTAEAWLRNQDASKTEIMALFRQTYGESARLHFARWRVFFMACAELWGWRGGEEWFVSHYRFTKR